MTLKNDKWERHLLRWANRDPEKEERMVTILRVPRGRWRVHMLWSLKSKIYGEKKRRNRLWLPHVPVHHSRLKMDTCSFYSPTTALPLHGERSRSSDPDQMISAALGWFLKDFFQKKRKGVMINAINKFWTRTSLLPSVKTMIFNPISDTILISVFLIDIRYLVARASRCFVSS
jgi:hypothetical protein